MKSEDVATKLAGCSSSVELLSGSMTFTVCDLENHHATLMGKSTISTGSLSIAMLNYQRVLTCLACLSCSSKYN